MTDFASLYYPLIGKPQPQFAVMHRALFCIVADANKQPGVSPEEMYYIAEDSVPLNLLDHRGWLVATLSNTVNGYCLTSMNVPLRKRADSAHGSKSVIVSKSPQYIVDALHRHRRGLLSTTNRILTEVADLYQGCASFINSDVNTQQGAAPSTVNVTLSGSLVYVLNEVMSGRMAVNEVDPEHQDRLKAFFDSVKYTMKASYSAYERQKTMLNGDKWVVMSSHNGLHVGAFRSEKIDGAGVYRRLKDILEIEPLRLYSSMDELKEKNPAAYGDIMVGVADAIALAKSTGIRTFRSKVKGIEELPYSCVEEAGLFLRLRMGTESWVFMMDKRS